MEETKADQETKPFGEIKHTIEDLIDSFINKKFKEHSYDSKQAQKWANNTSEEIIKRV